MGRSRQYGGVGVRSRGPQGEWVTGRCGPQVGVGNREG